ncbi:hypothetical protein MY4038_008956 [Beauveria bassiana]
MVDEVYLNRPLVTAGEPSDVPALSRWWVIIARLIGYEIRNGVIIASQKQMEECPEVMKK